MPSLTPYTTLPYTKHPLYKLRRATLLTILIGSIFHFGAIVQGPFFGISLFFLALSGLYIIYDLLTWAVEKRKTILTNAHRQYQRIIRRLPPSNCGPFGCPRCSRGDHQPLPTEHADTDPASPVLDRGAPPHHTAAREDDDDDDDGDVEPRWPRLILLIADAIFAVVFQGLFWCCLIFVLNQNYYYYYGNSGVLVWQSYASLVDLVMSLLHAVAWWKELMARKKEEWRKDERQERAAGRRGGPDGEDGAVRGGERWRGLCFGAKGRDKGREGEVDVAAAAGSASSEEEVLIAPTPDDASDKGYGTLDASVQSLSGEPDVVVKKGKGKRVVGKGWLGGDADAAAA